MAADRGACTRRARVGLLFALAAGCGSGSSDAEQPRSAEVAEPERVVVTTTAPAASVRRPARPATPQPDSLEGTFPHAEHPDIDCHGCHGRPTSHVTHLEADCSTCHSAPRLERPATDADPMRCSTCHHSETGSAGCRSCHQGIADREPIIARAGGGGATGSQVRTLPFAHGDHLTAECTACHTEAVTRAVGTECTACHRSHHRPASRCETCHGPIDIAAHDNRVHSGCAGGGCHSDATVLALPLTRNTCLLCHPAQTGHRADQDCAVCHLGESISSNSGGARGHAAAEGGRG